MATNQPGPRSFELVLGGGGGKGFAHIGVIKALLELKIQIETVTGVSIGSIIAVLLQNGFTPDEIMKIMLVQMAVFHQSLFGAAGRGGWKRLARLLRGVDLLPFFTALMRDYELQAKSNLRIVAFDVLKRRPVVFQGGQINLPLAVTASCSFPLVMRPVWLGEWKDGRTIKTIVDRLRNKVSETVLVDGALHHPAPTEFCQRPAIVSDLGMASKMPPEPVPLAEHVFHTVELIAGRVLSWYHRRSSIAASGSASQERLDHIHIRSGMPDAGALSFGVSEKKAIDMVDYAYRETKAVLAQKGIT